MHLSRYSVIEKLSNGSYFILSTISKGLIVLSPEKYNKLCLGQALECFSPPEIEYLVTHHFLVDDETDETNFLYVEMNRDRFHPQIFSTYIALSTLCNFSCVYCYEQGQVNEYTKMSDETLNATIEWYRNILVSKHYQQCNVCLYGGEPLLFKDLLIQFVEKMRKMTDSINVSLTFTMISNGYLLNEKICDYLISQGLKEIQITLDGCKETHDRRRVLKSGAGTFDTILSNICNIINRKIKIVIRSSFDESNVYDIVNLLQLLKKMNLEKNIYLYFAPIHQTESQKTNSCSFCSQHIYSEYKEIANYYCELYKAANKLGFKIPSCYSNGPCMVIGADSCLIAPDGALYKCVEMIGNDKLKIGDVFSKQYNSRYYDFMVACEFDKCIKSGCKYAPNCAGGCSMEAYIKNDSFRSTMCHKEIFDILDVQLGKLKCGGVTNG